MCNVIFKLKTTKFPNSFEIAVTKFLTAFIGRILGRLINTKMIEATASIENIEAEVNTPIQFL
tara:strand:- start:162 stop:350 length:189 start_codon:yes stop_codon:yes gene_type:complete